MAVGTAQDANSINSWAGAISLDLERVMDNITHMKAFLDATTDATLEAAPYSFSAGDVANLRSAFTDAKKLSDVYHGLATQAATYDFTTFLKLLRGVSCW